MSYFTRVLGLGCVVLLVVWFTGCGLGGRTVQKDLLAIEVEQQQEEVTELRAISDTLTNVRTRMLDDLKNLQELNSLSQDQIAVLEAESPPVEESVFAKLGKGLKKLWPF